MDLKDSLSKFKQQQERCQSSLASIAASTSKPKHRAQPVHAPNIPARPSQPIKFSNDTERLQHINSIRKSPVGAQIKLVIELLYKTRQAFTAEQINEATYVDIHGNKAVFDSLRNNPKVSYDGRRFSYKPPVFSPSDSFSDLEQQPDHPSSSQERPEETQSMDISAIEKMFLVAAHQVVQPALDGLSVSTLREPGRRATLETISASLPVNFASISTIKSMLDKLIDISKQLQHAHAEFAANSGQVDHDVSVAQQELSLKKDALQATTQEIASISEKKTEISAEVVRLNRALHEFDEKEKELLNTQSAQNSEVKEQEQALCEATAQANARANDVLQVKIMAPTQEAEKLFSDLSQSSIAN